MALIDLFAAFLGIFLFGYTAKAPNPPDLTENLSSPVKAETETKLTETANGSIEVNAESLAKCLTSKGAKMYGAYWCPHCQNQKKEFGSAIKFVSYQECDSKGENGNPEACQKAGVEGYPTWIFADGTKLEGQQTLSELAKKSGCN